MYAYFKDETVWRGRMLAAMCELKRAILLLGLLGTVLYLAFALAKWWPTGPVFVAGVAFLALLGMILDETRYLRTIDRDILGK